VTTETFNFIFYYRYCPISVEDAGSERRWHAWSCRIYLGHSQL